LFTGEEVLMREEIQAVLLKIIIFCKLSKIFAFIVPDAKAHRTGFSAGWALASSYMVWPYPLNLRQMSK
jgi:hypothetical protein